MTLLFQGENLFGMNQSFSHNHRISGKNIKQLKLFLADLDDLKHLTNEAFNWLHSDDL